MTADDTSSPVTLSINGADNVGKSTQLRWLSRGVPGCHLAGTIGEWDPRWERLAAGDFAHWWFADSSTREHVDLVFTSHSARRRGSAAFALEDRGRPMLLALCAATAAGKENRPAEDALGHVETLAAEHAIDERREIHVLLRHAQGPDEEVRLALAREQRSTSRWYIDYQHALARILDLQARRGDYDQVVLRGDQPILPAQRELREQLRAYGLPVESLPALTELDTVLVLAGMSESGKSTVGGMLRTEYGWSRLKIGYLLDVAAARAGVTDPYACWDETEQAEALSEEILRFSRCNKSSQLVLESAHRLDATRHLKRIWGGQCEVVYLDANSDDRLSRSGEGADSLRERDNVKRDRGTDHIAGIADWVLDNSGSLAELKLATARLASAHAGDETPSVSTATLKAPAAVQEWIDEAVHRLVDSSVAAVLVTGSTGQAHWRDGWSDIDLLVIRDTLPLRWIRDTVTSLQAPDGVKAEVSLFTTEEIADYRVPPRVMHALRLACRDGRGVLFLRDGFDLPVPGPSLDDRASRRELPQVVMTLRRLVTADPVDVRAVYKHIVLVMKILLRADGIDAETSDEVQQQFSVAHPAAEVALPTLQKMAPLNSRHHPALARRVLAAADSLLRYHDSLGSTLTPFDHQRS